MALEASDRLNYIIWVNWRCTCGCISRPTFKLTASLLDIMGKSKEISQVFRNKIVDLHKSGSSLGAISKGLKLPHSSVQTTVRKYKHHGTTQQSYRSGRRHVLSPRDERTLVRKMQINQEQQRTVWRYWRKKIQKYLYPQKNEIYIDITWKAAQQGRSHCSKTTIKKPDHGLQLHMGTKIVLFGEMSSGMMKQK